jgi:UDP:flavonoid glycosyltransferase YjiC (YdhE family)
MSQEPRVLLLPSPPSSGSVGSVTKMLGVARSLRARGCQVRFVVGGKLAELITRNGFTVAPYPEPRPAATVQPIRNIADVIQWTGMADPDFVEAAVEAEIAAIRDFRPDVVFAETRPSAAISVPALGVPFAVIASWPIHPDFPANRECSEQLLAVFNRQLKRYQLPEIENVAELLCLRGDVKLAPTLPELEPELQVVPGVQFVGYILDVKRDDSQLPAWYRGWHKRPLIFVYLSVGAISPDLYLRIIPAAFEELPFDVLCACGFHYDLKALSQATGNVRFERFIPTQAVIEDACLVIFHGGQDTMLTTLLHGLPSLTIPGQHFERVYNATQLARLGASKMLPVHAFRPRRLQAVVEEVLNGLQASASRGLSLRFQNYGGTEQCADILLSTAGYRA